MKQHSDIAIIGAGPAGMAAAALAASHGAAVTLLDEQPRPGGQIYRNIDSQRASDPGILGAEYHAGKPLADRLRASGADYVPGATVWHLSEDREIGVTVNDTAQLITADQVILATGAMERPFPVPGWTLPGVMNAGAAQILLKSSGVTLPDPVFIGTGPLLYLIAHQYLRAGVKIAAILDTTPRENYRTARGHLPGALRDIASLWKGWRWIKDLRASGTTFVRNVEDIRITGTDQATAVDYCVSGQWRSLPAQTVLLHQGVVPNPNLAMAAGCAHHWHEAQACWHATVDDWNVSSLSGIAIAGDGAAIAGANAAESSGQLAALDALHRLGKLDAAHRDALAAPLRKTLTRHAGLRRFLDVLYRPAPQFRIPPGDATIVCRCEEVTVAAIREAIALGCQGPNQLKSFTRAGMGPCQGRFCGLTVCETIADALGQPVGQIGAARLRPPVKPLELGQLAALDDAD